PPTKAAQISSLPLDYLSHHEGVGRAIGNLTDCYLRLAGEGGSVLRPFVMIRMVLAVIGDLLRTGGEPVGRVTAEGRPTERNAVQRRLEEARIAVVDGVVVAGDGI